MSKSGCCERVCKLFSPSSSAPAESRRDLLVEGNQTQNQRQEQAPAKQQKLKMPKIFIVYYSMYGHVKQLALKVKEGIEKTGCEVVIYQVAETLPAEVLEKMHAPPKDAEIPVLDVHDLAQADGIIFGVPTRFGMLPAQMKAMFDATGGLWQTGALIGKPASVFFSTATLGGGQETTALTLVTQFSHHGMIYVPIGPSSPLIFSLDEIHGGSAYGAGTIAGPDGSRQPSELELGLATHQGEHFAKVVKALTLGREQL